MTGHLVRFDLRSISFAGNVPGLVALAVLCVILIGHEAPEHTSSLLIVCGAGVAMLVFLAATLALDRGIYALSDGVQSAGPLMLSVAGVSGIWRYTDDLAERRAMIAGLGLTGALAAFTLPLAFGFRQSATLAESFVFVVAIMICTGSLVRLCPIHAFPGGTAARRSFALLASEDDGIGTASKVMSYWSSFVLAMGGFVILANPGFWGPWGLALLVLGADCALLTRWHSQRVQWIEKASARSLESIRFSRLPTVSQSAPVSELFSIFAVEGNRATIVVTDERSQPCGLIQLQHLKSATRAGLSVQPDELMLTLSDLPEFACESSILDAAMALERRGISALVTQCGDGKRRVISLDELLRLGEMAD